MTRKCVLCKKTNYRNTYSFFSAPKDLQTRKKWQAAIAIDNYDVTDDTYVCSKHFHKDDIITHWVSGVPPHVITIKYKKCRLRPGAVPSRHLDENYINPDLLEDSDINMSDYLTFKPEKDDEQPQKKTFAVPRINARFRRKRAQNSKSKDTEQHSPEDAAKTKHPPKDKKPLRAQRSKETKVAEVTLSPEKMEMPESGSQEPISTEDTEKETEVDAFALKQELDENDKIEEMHVEEENPEMTETRNGSESPGAFNHSDVDDTSTEMWVQEETIQESKEDEDNVYNESQAENQTFSTESYESLEQFSPCKENEEPEMLFEDLLEVCSEIMLPEGWSSVVTSKGHTTTVVYLYMGMSKNGMPYVQKQVFLKSDMVLRCAANNREINPLMHNLIRDGKHLNVHTLIDLEELIDEFDQRTVCEGVTDTEECQEINVSQVAYNDGVSWRHVSCPLILNNDSSKCTSCITLSLMLSQSAENFSPFEYNPPIFSKKQQKVYSTGQTRKRIRKHERRYDFIKVLTE